MVAGAHSCWPHQIAVVVSWRISTSADHSHACRGGGQDDPVGRSRGKGLAGEVVVLLDDDDGRGRRVRARQA